MTMQQIIFRQHGDPHEVLELDTVPEPPPPAEGQVVVRVIKLPIHSGDVLVVNGLHNPRLYDVPDGGLTPGAEGAGILEAVGPGVEKSRGLILGAHVSFFAVGTWKQKLVLPADSVFVVPEGVDDDLASQLYVNPMAAMLLVREVVKAAGRQIGNLRLAATKAILSADQPESDEPGVVLLSAAGSTTAKLVAVLLRQEGFRLVGIVRSQAGASALTASTGMATVTTEDANWKDRVRQIARGGKIFAALDAVGGPLSTDMLDLLAPGGTLLSYGILSGEPLIIPQAPLTMENKLVYGVGMVHWSLLTYDERAADLATMTDFLRRNRHLLPTSAEFKFSDVKDAIKQFSQTGRNGIILLTL